MEMATDTKALLAFLDRCAKTDQLSPEMALALSRATGSILRTVAPENWLELDMQTVAIDDVFTEYRSRRPELKLNTIGEYRRRFGRAVTLFRDYLQAAKGEGACDMSTQEEQLHEVQRSPSESEPVSIRPTPKPISSEKSQPLIAYPFPLRDNCIVTLQLPPDLTQQEVKRLTTFLNALAVASE
jgi:hypothetical protein